MRSGQGEGGAFVNPFVQRVGPDRAAWFSAVAVVFGLAVYALLSSFGYGWVAIALVLVAAGLRVVGVVAGVHVLRGLPENRTTIGAALIDTASEVTSGVGIAVTGTILATLFTGNIATVGWSAQQTAEFQEAVTSAGFVLTVVAAALVGWAMLRARSAADDQASTSISDAFGGYISCLDAEPLTAVARGYLDALPHRGTGGQCASHREPCSLFIDPIGRPLSPVSVAGVRRRERCRDRC